MYYVSPDARLFFASWSATPAPSVGAPTPIETSAIYEAIAPRSFDVAPDGKRLLVIEPINTGPLDAPSVTVVLNWVEDLKRMAGSGSHPPR
jgi:hypothetical protein